MDNIFQIWDKNGRIVPFKARRNTWNEKHTLVVEKIICKKLPYGEAYGYYTTNGIKNDWDHGNISCAGCYQWKLIP